MAVPLPRSIFRCLTHLAFLSVVTWLAFDAAIIWIMVRDAPHSGLGDIPDFILASLFTSLWLGAAVALMAIVVFSPSQALIGIVIHSFASKVSLFNSFALVLFIPAAANPSSPWIHGITIPRLLLFTTLELLLFSFKIGRAHV